MSTPTTITSLVLFLCWVIVAQCRAGDLKISFTDYMAIHNGYFNNQWEMEDGGPDTETIEFTVKPVLAPGLQKDPALYTEEVLNGTIYRMVVIVRNESSTNHILYLTYYNFTDTSLYTPGQFNTDNLVNLAPGDFQVAGGCEAAYEKVSATVLSGEGLDCRHKVNGQYPRYGTTVTCDDFYIVPPASSDEVSSFAPYHLKRAGPKYPLINAPDDYVNPCLTAQ